MDPFTAAGFGDDGGGFMSGAAAGDEQAYVAGNESGDSFSPPPPFAGSGGYDASGEGGSGYEGSSSSHTSRLRFDSLNLYAGRSNMMQSLWQKWKEARQEEEKAHKERIFQVQQLARECGASEGDPTLWRGVHKICMHQNSMAFFIGTRPQGRMSLIQQFARDDVQMPRRSSSESDDEFEDAIINMILEDDAATYAHVSWCMEVLSGELGLSKSAGVPGAVQGHKGPSSRISKRRRTTRN